MTNAVFRPSMVAVVAFTFDDDLVQEARAQLQEATTIAQLTRSGVPASRGTSEQSMAARAQNAENTFVVQIPVLEGGVDIPGHRMAGQFNLTFPLRNFPLDPRSISAYSVDVHLDAVSAGHAAQVGRSTTGPSPLIAVPTRDNLLLSGSGDKNNTKFKSSSSADTVTLTGRDVRAILLDTPLERAQGDAKHILESLNMSQPIHLLVRQLLSFHPLLQRFTVVVNELEWPVSRRDDGTTVEGPPFLSDPDMVPRHRKGAKGDRKSPRATPPGGNIPGSQSVNYWDLIVRWCYLVGAIPTIRGTDIVIRPSRTLFDQATGDVDPVRNPTPFKLGMRRGVDAESGAPITPALTYRQIVHGRDIDELEYSRTYGGYHRPKVVRVVTTDHSREGAAVQVMAVWPREADWPKWTKTAASGGKHMEILDVPVSGVWDPKQLEIVAQSIYEEMGRGEMGGSAVTTRMSSFGGDESDPDMCRLRPGDGIEILTLARKQGLYGGSAQEREGMSFEQEVREVQKAFPDPILARIIVGTRRGSARPLQRFFRVSSAKYNIGTSGLKIAFDFQNYAVAKFGRQETHTNAPASRVSASQKAQGVFGSFGGKR